MKGLSKQNNNSFARTFWRDVALLLVISMICAIGIVFTLYYSVQNNW